MKKSGPLRRGNKLFSRAALRPQSTERAQWNLRYREQHRADGAMQRCAWTGERHWKQDLERHHVAGRIGQRILIYCYLLPEKHRWIEDHSREARALGWVRNERASYAKDPNQNRPWIAGTLVNERLLDK